MPSIGYLRPSSLFRDIADGEEAIAYHLRYLSPRGIVLRTEGAISIPSYDVSVRHPLDELVEGVVRWYIAESLPPYLLSERSCVGDDLGDLPSCGGVEWAEGVIIVPTYDGPVRQPLDEHIEGMVRRHIPEGLASRLVLKACCVGDDLR